MMTDVLIVGGGIAGMTAALYVCRAGRTVTLVEAGNFGGQITAAHRVDNYPGVARVEGAALAAELLAQVTALGVQPVTDTVRAIERQPDGFTATGDRGTYRARCVIAATGTRHRVLGLPREETLTGRGVSYCAVCDGAFFRGKAVAVVGGGSAALHAAAYLADVCAHVTLIHRRDTFRGEALAAAQLRERNNVTLLLNSRVVGLQGDPVLTGLEVDTDGTVTRLPVSGLFVAVGQQPDNQIFAPLVTLEEGYIRAGEDTATSCPGLFAAGDCRTKQVRQLTTAAADGTVAALAACRYVSGED